MEKTATQILLEREDEKRRAHTFELMLARFTEDYAPEDPREAAEFSARISAIMRQLFMDVQKPLHDAYLSAAMRSMNPMVFSDPPTTKDTQ